ncbi:MAG: class II aldolase/adducin family protein [Solirubrobacterales bacterium]|nr:class II aldolase/adducin family protein [Solirubrobacterales bacterium]
MAVADVRSEVVRGGRVLALAGLSDMVWGHVSARDPSGRGVWMKANGLGFEEVTDDDVLLLDYDGNVLAGRGSPHREYPIHTEILRRSAGVASVVHVHPPHAIALAASALELQAFSHVAGVFAGGVRRYRDGAGLIDSAAAGAALADALKDDRALFLTGHGVITAGPSVAVAVTTAVMLERACHLQLLAEGYGGVAAPLSSDEALQVYAHTQTDKHLLGAWEYLSRKVDRYRSATSLTDQ